MTIIDMFKKSILGRTGIEVTELCFGALPMGPLQKNVSPAECSEMLVKALQQGVNFVDTAQMYKTYKPIKMAMDKTGIRPVIATKSTVSTYEDMQKAVDEALSEFEIDCIDIFLLHAARAKDTVFEDRKGALECLLENRRKGRIKAVGISSHSIPVIRKASDNPSIDIVLSILNLTGVGLIDGNRSDMEDAVQACIKNGKGVYLMKALAGGVLTPRYDEAMSYVRAIPGVASIAVGMVKMPEAEYNLKYFKGQNPGKLAQSLVEAKEYQVFRTICISCGKCIDICGADAISKVEGKAKIDESKCVRCGYCFGACPQFAIRMV